MRLKTYGLQSHAKYRGLTVQFSHRCMLSSVLMSLRRTWRALPVWASLFALVVADAAGGAELSGTLPEDYVPALKPILAAALKQSPKIIAQDIEISQREAQAIQIEALRLPNLSGHLDYVRNQTAISSNSATQSTDGGLFGGVAVNQPVFHWGALDNQSAAARIRVAIAEKNLLEAYRLLTVDLRQRYLSLIVRKAGLRQARFALGLTAFDLNFTKENFAKGQVSKEALDTQQLSYDETSLGIENSEAVFDNLRRDFIRLSGIGELPEDSIPLEISKPAYSADVAAELLAGLLRADGKGTFQAQAYELMIHESDLSYQVARVRLLPKFNASAGYSLENTTNATATSVMQQGVARETVALSAQWNIFDGLATRGAKAEAIAGKRQHERELKTVAEETIDRAQTLKRQLAIDARMLEFEEIHHRQAVDDLTRAKEELERGNLSKRTVDGVANSLYSRDPSLAAARATLLIDWSEFVSLTGADPMLNTISAQHAREKR